MLQKHALFRENCLNKIRIAYIKKATRLIPYVIKKFYLNYDSKKIVSWKARNRFIKGPKLTGNIWKYMWSVLFKLATLKGTDSLFAGNSKKNYFLMTHYYHLKSFTIVNSLLLFYQKQHELRNIFFSDKKFLRTQDIHWIYFKLFYKKKNIFSTFFHKKNWRPFMFSNKVIRDYNAPLLVWPIWHHKTYSKYLLSNLKKYVSKHWLVDFLGLGNNLLTKKNKDLFFNKHLFIKKNSKISTKFSYNSLLLNVYYNNINRFVFNNIKRGILKTSQLKSLSTKDKGYKKIAAIFFNNKLKVKPRYTSIFRYLKIYSKNKELIINKNSTIFKHNTVLQKTIKVSSTKQKNIVKNVDFNFVRGVYTTNLYYNKWNY